MRFALTDLHKRLWVWIIVAAVVIVVVVIALLASPSSSDKASIASAYSQHPEDVTITSCTVTNGRLTGRVSVINRSPNEATYAVKVDFASPDGKKQFDTGTAIVSELQPGKSASAALAVSKRVGEVPVKCSVLEAARYGT